MTVLDLPGSILIKDLLQTSPEYSSDAIEEADALYHGGDKFTERMDDFLVRRKIEERDGKHYELRKRRACYVPYIGGLIDYICAKAFVDGVRVDVLGPNASYYDSLNENTDGFGKSMSSLARETLAHAMLFGRAYLFPDFPAAVMTSRSRDARIRMVEPGAVDDWQMDEAGHLTWARIHVSELIRDDSKSWIPPSIERHVWTFIDSEYITIYEGRRRAGGGAWIDEHAKQIRRDAHGFDGVPLVDVKVPESMEVMGRCKSTAVALFNREASITWALDMAAYATLVLTLDQTQISEIVSSELAAMRLRVGESAAYIAPPGGIFEPLFKDADRLKNNLMEIVRGQGIDAAKVPQAGRMSGDAVRAMADPAQAMMMTFADPVIEAIHRVIDGIRTERGDLDRVRVISGEATAIDETDDASIPEPTPEAMVDAPADDAAADVVPMADPMPSEPAEHVAPLIDESTDKIIGAVDALKDSVDALKAEVDAMKITQAVKNEPVIVNVAPAQNTRRNMVVRKGSDGTMNITEESGA